jgi:hypothetical protein
MLPSCRSVDNEERALNVRKASLLYFPSDPRQMFELHSKFSAAFPGEQAGTAGLQYLLGTGRMLAHFGSERRSINGHWFGRLERSIFDLSPSELLWIGTKIDCWTLVRASRTLDIRLVPHRNYRISSLAGLVNRRVKGCFLAAGASITRSERSMYVERPCFTSPRTRDKCSNFTQSSLLRSSGEQAGTAGLQ